MPLLPVRSRSYMNNIIIVYVAFVNFYLTTITRTMLCYTDSHRAVTAKGLSYHSALIGTERAATINILY